MPEQIEKNTFREDNQVQISSHSKKPISPFEVAEKVYRLMQKDLIRENERLGK